MNILIVGCGKAGSILAQTLSNEGHDITVMDTDSEVVTELVNNLDVQGIVGSALIARDLKEAGVEGANIIIAMTASDEANILCCLMARKLGARHSVARVRNPAYSEQMVFMREELGLSMMINPEYQTANDIARMLRYPKANHVETFAKGRMDLAEIKVSQGSFLDGLQLAAIAPKLGLHMLVCAVKRGGEITIPDGSYRLRADDLIYITAAHAELGKLYKMIRAEQFGNGCGNGVDERISADSRRNAELVLNLSLSIHAGCSVLRDICDPVGELFARLRILRADRAFKHAVIGNHVGCRACCQMSNSDDSGVKRRHAARNYGLKRSDDIGSRHDRVNALFGMGSMPAPACHSDFE